MGIYNFIKSLGRKTLTSIVLAGALALGGCGDTYVTQYKTTQIFRDLNGDGNPESITLKLKGYTDKKHSYFRQNSYYWKNNHADYSLEVMDGLGEGRFGEPRETHLFHGKPEEIRIEDITGDGNPDLIFLKLKGYTDKKHSYFRQNSYYWKNNHPDYSLMVSKGNGDGTFSKPIESLVFHGKPEGMH